MELYWLRENMISFLLLFFGVTFFYAGVLTLPQDPHLGVATSLFGLFLALRPLFEIFRHLKGMQVPQKSASLGETKKPRPKGKGHLRIVRPEEDEGRPPTIH